MHKTHVSYETRYGKTMVEAYILDSPARCYCCRQYGIWLEVKRYGLGLVGCIDCGVIYWIGAGAREAWVSCTIWEDEGFLQLLDIFTDWNYVGTQTS